MNPSIAPATDSSKARPSQSWLVRLAGPAIFLAVGIVLIILMGAAQRLGWISGGGVNRTTASSTAGQVFTCPMHPQIRQPGPGRCPICGMSLVPATSATAIDEMAVTIEPAQRRLANIQTAPVVSQPVADVLHTVGAIAIDESRMATIASYIDGRLERLFADYTGVVVSQGDHLAVIYSPELYSAQVEFLETRRAVRQMSAGTLDTVRQAQEKLLASLRERLSELGMTEDQIQELESSDVAKSRLTIYTPIGGTVIEKLAVEGKYVKAGEPIYRVADLSTVWLVLELFPEDAARVRFGQRVSAELQSLPGETFEGRIAFVAPIVDPEKRVVRVRVEFLNPDGLLRPGDYANASIRLPIGQEGEVYDAHLAGRWISPMHPQIIRDSPGVCPICGMDLLPTTLFGYSDTPVEQPASLVVPRTAVLMAGSHSVVYVETEPGRFEIRPVKLGPILQDKVIIVEGLAEGERVATAGNFLIDSQMQLAGKPSLIDPTRAIERQQERRQPLEFDSQPVTIVAGEAGRQLDQLFTAYFRIQKDLADDRQPAESDADTLRTLSQSLAADSHFDDAAQKQLAAIAEHSENLQHPDITQARLDAFRPISHAIVTLATLVQPETATSPFYHMFCPMVPGGSGDWLQDDEQLVNPYWGHKMHHCGNVVREISRTPVEPNSSVEETDTAVSPSPAKE